MRVRPETLEPHWGSCPRCGDSLQNARVDLPDHGGLIMVDLGWCEDCLRVRGEHILDLGQRCQADD
jgi:hypothetical protein